MFKECLKYNIVPFIIEDDSKDSYYEHISKWPDNEEELLKICLNSQNKFKAYLKKFKIKY